MSAGTARLAGQTLLWIASVAAAAAALSSIGVVLAADPATRMVETWRGYGFAAFAMIFALLARRPGASPVLWATVTVNKLALTVTALGYRAQGGVTGVDDVIVWDGTLTVLLVAAMILTRGRAGTRPPLGSAQSATRRGRRPFAHLG